jgi:hypothetical protein
MLWRYRRALLAADAAPVVVDLGFGSSAVTTVELAERVRAARPDAHVLGVEIDPARVADAQRFAEPGVQFVRGGFDFALPAPFDARGATVIRAFNVLRQYDEAEVATAWRLMTQRLTPGGALIDGTCDEIGRRAAWIEVGPDAQARSLTFATRLGGLVRPSDLAERLPKALIHRNVPGENVHALLSELDRWWDRSSTRVFGARQRWIDVVGRLREAGWPVLDGPSRWRLGELTVRWDAVAPR